MLRILFTTFIVHYPEFYSGYCLQTLPYVPFPKLIIDQFHVVSTEVQSYDYLNLKLLQALQGSVADEILNSKDDYFLVKLNGIESPNEYSYPKHWFDSAKDGINIIQNKSKRFNWIFVDVNNKVL